MKLSDIELDETQLAGLERLFGKVASSQRASRDASDITYRTFGFETRAASLDIEGRSLEVVASSEAIDSYNEIVKQDWQLDRYRKNPAVLYAHNAVGLCGPAEDTLPIGFASNVRIEGGKLVARLHFVDEKAAPMAEKVWQGVKQGSLRAVSVGFKPGKISKEIDPDTGQTKRIILSENDLYEISVCPVGANPEAVARSAERNYRQALRIADEQELARRAAAPDPVETPDPVKSDIDEKLWRITRRMVERMTSDNPSPPPSSGSEQDEMTITKEAYDKLQAELDSAKAAITKLEADRDAAIKLSGDDKAKTAVEAVNAVVERANAATKRADDLDAKVCELEVDALVGKKIAPVERDEFVELRRSNPKLFAKMVEKKADISDLGREITKDDSGESKATKTAGSSRLLKAVQGKG